MDTKPKVLVTRSDHDSAAIKRLEGLCDVEVFAGCGSMTRSQLLEKVKGKHGLLIMPPRDKIDEELINAAGGQLKVISTHSVGFDHIDLALMKERGIKVGFTPGVLTNDAADLTVCLTLMTLRNVKQQVQTIADDTWKNADGSPFFLVGTSLTGKTVGILGMGRIGLATAKRLSGFEVGKIIYNGKHEKPEAEAYEFVSFDQLLAESDVLIVTSALNEETREIINWEAFKKMKKSAFLINTSRGGLVQQDDLVKALKEGEIAGAGLDVMTPEPLPPSHDLVKLPNACLTPHIGTSTRETRVTMINLVVDNLLAGLEDRPMPARLC